MMKPEQVLAEQPVIKRRLLSFGALEAFWNAYQAKAWSTRVYDFVGRRVIGDPESIELDADFYYDIEDRALPTSSEFGIPKVQVNQLSSEKMRQEMRWAVAIYSTVLAAIVCTAMCVGFAFAMSAVVKAKEWRQDSQLRGQVNQACENARRNPNMSAEDLKVYCDDVDDRVSKIKEQLNGEGK